MSPSEMVPDQSETQVGAESRPMMNGPQLGTLDSMVPGWRRPNYERGLGKMVGPDMGNLGLVGQIN